LQLFEQQSELIEQLSLFTLQLPATHALVSYWQLALQLSAPLTKPRLEHVSPSARPGSHCSLPSITPSPQTVLTGVVAQTRFEGLPPVQFPTPEQQFVDALQACPPPSATHVGAQSSEQLEEVSPPLQVPSPQTEPQSITQLTESSAPVQSASPQKSGQSIAHDTGVSEPVQSASPQTSGQSVGHEAAVSPPLQTASPQMEASA
jgi:hypothetical protein